MVNEYYSYKKEHLKRLIFNGFLAAIESHKEIFKKPDDNSTLALAFLNQAHTYYVNAETLLVDNVDLFDVRHEFDELFQRFKVYNDEVLDVIQNTQNHQWSDIEFRSFVNKFKIVADLLDIQNPDYWIDKALSDE